jgi:hypothetical protein
VKSIEVLHPSFAVYAAVTLVALVVVIGLIATSPGVARHLPRLGKCAVLGAAAAAALDIFVDTKRHAALVTSAAKPASGHHLSTTYILADGFAFTFLIVTVVTFIIATVVARRRRAPAPWQAPARPRAGAGTWLS